MLTPRFIHADDTIAAIATPSGVGGIGVVKISGPQSLPIARRLFLRDRCNDCGLLSPHRLHVGYITDPCTQEIVDEVLLVYMRAPHSYTKEDVIEIQCHSGFAVIERILHLVLSMEGVRLAEPGEFTRRAFLNGRMDLTRVEAVADLVSARSEAGVKQAASQLQGALYDCIQGLKHKLTAITAHVETAIDFPEEDVEILSTNEIESRLRELGNEVRELLATYHEGRLYREGVRAAIIGRPNVGKSSLLNALLNEERAIVCSMPGTTRDTIEESITVNGMVVTFVDTAGLSSIPSRDPVERMGTERTRMHVEKADVVLCVLDGSASFHEEDRLILEDVRHKACVLVVNKRDLPQSLSASDLPHHMKQVPQVSVSAKYGQRIDELKRVLRDRIMEKNNSNEKSPVFINRLRHKHALEKAGLGIEQTCRGLAEGASLECIILDLRESLDSLGGIVGETTPEDVLEQVFSEFCIGK